MVPNEVTKAVQIYLQESHLDGITSNRVAAWIGISDTAMRDQLKECDTSWSELLTWERTTRAYNAVSARPNIPVSALMDLLGYSDSQSMYRAVERWFGVSLKDFRQLARIRAPAEAGANEERGPRI